MRHGRGRNYNSRIGTVDGRNGQSSGMKFVFQKLTYLIINFIFTISYRNLESYRCVYYFISI
ncbi:hypothetical protein HMPREF2531_02257 [Bacteroides intestinalis]|uniref:Uncharacterized protein n=1 Tax=Bacteroides intestinalis TaxID=329854 RepID=A0A139LGS7_9BACE|nr:hypothetical protein HMPREF2531_02257 [Bacteroides intestinalis]